MTEETSATQVSFYQCLCHETKKAYAPWIKVVVAFLIIAGVLAIVSYTKDNIITGLTQISQLVNIVPWYVCVFTTLILMPLVYATGICINKRVDPGISSTIFLVSMIFTAVLVLLGAGLTNTLFVTLGLLVFAFAIGVGRD
jgi:hypothetical protein